MHRGRSASVYLLITSFLGSDFIKKKMLKPILSEPISWNKVKGELFNILFTFQLDPGLCREMLLRRKLCIAKRDKGKKLLIEYNTMGK